MADGKVTLSTDIDDSGAKSGISKLGGTLGKVGSTALKSTGLAIGAVATGVSALGASAVKYNATIEQYSTSFEVMTGSADKAAETVKKLKEVGAKTPFEMTDLADTTQLLMNYGFSADGAMDKMMMLGDISQGSAEKMNRIATAYGQMSSAGKVQLEDIKQMIESGYNPLQEISKTTGESMESLYDRISSGTISVDEITASMQRSTSEGGKYFQSMEKQSQTVSGQFSTLKDNFSQLTGSIFSGVSTGIAGQLLPLANSWIGELSTAFESGGIDGLMEAFGKVLSEIVTKAVEFAPKLIEIAISILKMLVEGLIKQAPQISTAIIQIITTFVTGILDLLPQILQLGITLLISLMQGITESLPTLIPKIVEVILQIVDTLTNPDNLTMLITTGISLLFALIDGLVNAIPQLVSALPLIIKNIVMTLIQLLPELIPVAVQLIVTIALAITNAIPTLLSYFPQVFSAIVGAFKEIDWGEIGRNIIQGIIDGFKSMINKVKEAGTNVTNSIKNTFKEALGIHSPSTVFRGYGRYTGEGYILGFNDIDPLSQVTNSVKRGLGNLNISSKTQAQNITVSAPESNPVFQVNVNGSVAQLVRLLNPEFQKVQQKASVF